MREMKIRYTVLTALTISDLSEEVNRFIENNGEAWRPTGGITTGWYGSYSQALYRNI